MIILLNNLQDTSKQSYFKIPKCKPWACIHTEDLSGALFWVGLVNILHLNSSPIDELGKLVPGESVGGLTRLRHAERYPWQPCDREPPQHAAPPDTLTLKRNSVEPTILT